LLHPEAQFKFTWDIFIIAILFFSCLVTPYRIVFVPVDSPAWKGINLAIDGLFFIDILITFNTAYFDDQHKLIENRKMITCTYLKTWFLIDSLAIVPFDIIFNTGNFNEIVRLTRIGRMYKLIKLTKLLRVLKMVKERANLMDFVQDSLKIGIGFQRLSFFMLYFFIFCHIISCLWVMAA